MKSPKNEIAKKWNQQKKTLLTLPSLVRAQTPPIPAATQEIFWSPLLHLDGGGDYDDGDDYHDDAGEKNVAPPWWLMVLLVVIVMMMVVLLVVIIWWW